MKKNHNVVSAKFDLPFYLRLPSKGFLCYDEKHKYCTIMPIQRLGEKVFNKKTNLVNENELLDDPHTTPLTTSRIDGYDYKVRSIFDDTKEITTLETRVRPDGGFSQLQAYTEIIIFIYLQDEDPYSAEVKKRIFTNLNHFLKIYKLITQDSFVFNIDHELNLYCVDLGVGKIKEDANHMTVLDILKLKDVKFSSKIGTKRGIQLQMNVIDDIFPGRILEDKFMKIFAESILGIYDMPVYYDLILESQRQLKFRNYPAAIIECQTAVESYVSQLLTIFFKNEGLEMEKISTFFQDNMLHKRLRVLDDYILNLKNSKGESYERFINGNLYIEWKEKLYLLRNKIVHEGLRQLDFELTKDAIGVGKKVIFHFEGTLSEYRNSVQIYSGVEFLKNTAGRINF